MRYLLHFLIVTTYFSTTSFAQKSKAIFGVSTNLSTGYRESRYTNFEVGVGYNFQLGYQFKNSGVQIIGEFGKTHFDENDYDYYVPGYIDSYGTEIWNATHLAATLRWVLPEGAVRPYIQGSLGSTLFLYKDKIKVVEEVWDNDEQEWDEETSTWATYSERDGVSNSLNLGGGFLIRTSENIFLDFGLIRKSFRDKVNTFTNTQRFVGYQFSFGLNIEL